IMLANLLPGRSLSFAMQQGGSGSAQGSSSAFSGTGTLDYSVGFYFLTVTETGVTYQIVGAGDKLARLAGQTVTITGTLDPNATPEPPATAVIDVHEYKPKGAAALLIDGLLIM